MRLPTPDDPDPCRKPDNKTETFEDGEFADFIAPIVRTLDLYHTEGIDPRALALSFQQLQENNPEADIEIVSMEKRGKNKDKFLIRAETSQTADHSQLSAEYFTTYNHLRTLPPEMMHLLLTERDSQIRRLEAMVSTAIQRPGIYANNYHNEGNTMSDSKGNININSGDGSKISGIAGAGENLTATGSAIGDISGTVTNTINELPDTSAPEQPSLKALLRQLQAAIEAEPNLSKEDKAEALEQVKALAEAGQNPQEGGMQKLVKNAMRMLKGLVSELPNAAKLVGEVHQLLPVIAKVFGLG